MQGFAPARRGPFVSAKGPKTIPARLRPFQACSEQALQGPSAYTPNKMARELAALKQPRQKSRFGVPAPPHPKAGVPTE
ncbi:MAG: hypothetical protein O3A59_04845 [Nitrospirae bacterium]|nr:hypothetical protein [Nitrospirota bacterium]